jgi:hypothetical protein
MADTRPVSGHGVDVAVELDPVGDQGNFTTLGRLSSDFALNFERGVADAWSHDKGFQVKVVSSLLQGCEWNLSHWRVYGDTSQDGVKDLFLANTITGVRVTGVSNGAGPGVDEVISSGQFSSYNDSMPVGPDGVRQIECMFQPSDTIKIDGTVYT